MLTTPSIQLFREKAEGKFTQIEDVIIQSELATYEKPLRTPFKPNKEQMALIQAKLNEAKRKYYNPADTTTQSIFDNLQPVLKCRGLDDTATIIRLTRLADQEIASANTRAQAASASAEEDA